MRQSALNSILVPVALATLAACAPPAEPPATEPAAPAVDVAAEEQQIREFSQKWEAAEQERDLLTVMSFMSADVTTIFDGEIVSGRPAVESDIKARWEATQDATIEWTTSAVEVAASGDLAYERGSWSFDPDGDGPAAAESGEFVCIWKKFDGEWKVAVDAGSTIEADEA